MSVAPGSDTQEVHCGGGGRRLWSQTIQVQIPALLTCWLCDSEQVTKPVWASSCSSGNLMEVIRTCAIQWGGAG